MGIRDKSGINIHSKPCLIVLCVVLLSTPSLVFSSNNQSDGEPEIVSFIKQQKDVSFQRTESEAAASAKDRIDKILSRKFKLSIELELNEGGIKYDAEKEVLSTELTIQNYKRYKFTGNYMDRDNLPLIKVYEKKNPDKYFVGENEYGRFRITEYSGTNYFIVLTNREYREYYKKFDIPVPAETIGEIKKDLAWNIEVQPALIENSIKIVGENNFIDAAKVGFPYSYDFSGLCLSVKILKASLINTKTGKIFFEREFK